MEIITPRVQRLPPGLLDFIVLVVDDTTKSWNHLWQAFRQLLWQAIAHSRQELNTPKFRLPLLVFDAFKQGLQDLLHRGTPAH